MKLPVRTTSLFAFFASVISAVAFASSPSLGAETSAEPADIFSQAKQSVVFLYPSGSSPCTSAQDGAKFVGTGFLMNLSVSGSAKRSAPYLITNKHIVDKQTSLVMRVSTGKKCACQNVTISSSGADATMLSPKTSGVNLVAIRTTEIPDSKPLQVDYDSLVDAATLNALKVSEGHEIFAPDLFMPGVGTTENFALIRNGKISLLRGDQWMLAEIGPSQAYLGELGTTFGATGVPVFLLPEKRMMGAIKALTFAPAPVEVTVAETKLEDGIAVPRSVASRGVATVPNGLAVIEPADNLKELLEPVAQQLRK